MEQNNMFFGAVYGSEHIIARGEARAILIELNRIHEILYTPEVLHIAFEAMVRNFNDSAEEGVRRMSRVTRKGIRRVSLAEYALLPRADGSPAWISPNSFDMHSAAGFWKANFIPRLDAKFGNCMINTAMENGLPFSASAAGQAPMLTSGAEDADASYPVPVLLSEEAIKTCFEHAPMTGEKRICRDHTSWRSCPSGNICMFAHNAMPFENLHWLIRAQLAKRVGHRAHARIAPDAVPGYIATLRETNTPKDGEAPHATGKIWTPKTQQRENPPLQMGTAMNLRLSMLITQWAWFRAIL